MIPAIASNSLLGPGRRHGIRLPPGPPYPRALSTLGWMTRPLPFLERCQRRYGDIFTLKIAHEGVWVLLADPDAVKQVFTAKPEVVHAGEANAILEPVVGRHSVLLLDEKQHMAQRKLMLPPLHGERMQGYGELMRSIAEREIARWPVGEPLQMRTRMQAVTLEIIMRAVFGVREGTRLAELRGLLSHMLDWTTQPLQMASLALLGPRRVQSRQSFRAVMDPADSLVLDEIRARRTDPELGEREDILSLLVRARHEDGSELSDRELRDELMTLLVAGHETTATSIAWALERLVRHADKLERLTAEVQAGEEAYLEAVVRETLRLRPVLPIVVRKLTAPMEIGGHVLPAGITVAPCIHLIHRRPDVYPEPGRFLPERFEQTPPGTYTWIPFGGGVRRCLGASFALFEMKAVLAAVVSNVSLRPTRPDDERVSRRAITLTPSRDGEVVVTDRIAPATPAHDGTPVRDGPTPPHGRRPAPEPARTAT